jgi:putative membrane protein
VLRRISLVIAVLLLVAAAVIFAALNQQQFEIDIGLARFGVSSGLALLITFAAGLVAGAALSSAAIARLLTERGRLRNALRLAEARRAHPAPPSSPPDAG